jgi:uncharacterized protein YodC (DUF2158 family)
MATTFKKGDVVKAVAVIPQGPVLALRMSEDGVVSCLIEWTDADGETQHRWFEESRLTGA